MTPWEQQRQREQEMLDNCRREWLMEQLSQHRTITATAKAIGMHRASLSKETGRLVIMRWPNMLGTGSGQNCPKRDAKAIHLSKEGVTIFEAAQLLSMHVTSVMRMEERLDIKFERERQ